MASGNYIAPSKMRRSKQRMAIFNKIKSTKETIQTELNAKNTFMAVKLLQYNIEIKEENSLLKCEIVRLNKSSQNVDIALNFQKL